MGMTAVIVLALLLGKLSVFLNNASKFFFFLSGHFCVGVCVFFFNASEIIWVCYCCEVASTWHLTVTLFLTSSCPASLSAAKKLFRYWT